MQTSNPPTTGLRLNHPHLHPVQFARLPKPLIVHSIFQDKSQERGRLRMATILAPQFGREVLRCNHCDLVQFATPKKFCRRCRQPYDWEPSYEAEQADNSRTVESYPRTDSVRDRIAFNVLKLRQLRGLTQKEIGLRMGVPRTYVSKIEGRKVTPTLSSLDRLATLL